MNVELALTLSYGECRLCGRRSDLVVKKGQRTRYEYCTSCVDHALERAEVDQARAAQSSGGAR